MAVPGGSCTVDAFGCFKLCSVWAAWEFVTFQGVPQCRTSFFVAGAFVSRGVSFEVVPMVAVVTSPTTAGLSVWRSAAVVVM